MVDHALPGGPVVGVVGVPDEEFVGDAFGVEDAVEALVLAEALIVPAGGENVRAAAIAIEKPGVAEMGQEVHGLVVVDVSVVVAAEKVVQVEGAGHGEESGEDVGVAEGDVDGMKASEAAAERDEMGVLIFEAHEGDDFVDEVVVVLDMAGDAPARRDGFVIPALHVDRVGAKDLALAGVDFSGKGRDHSAIFKLEVASAGGGKHEDGHTGVAEYEEFHIAAKARRMPFVIFAIHRGSGQWTLDGGQVSVDGGPWNWRKA